MKTKFRPLRDAQTPVETRATKDIIGRWFIEYKKINGRWEYVQQLLPTSVIVPVCYKNEPTAKRIASWVKKHVTTIDNAPVNIIVLPPMSL